STNTMHVYGQKILKGNQIFDCFNDHRIAMSIIIASIKTDSPIIIKNVQAIKKSYPSFLSVFTSLKGAIEIDEELKR
ncbi:MAG: hypothetical protein ACOC1L_07385, partial [Bacillota bacterium]